jgi:small subunit ribosomal protein S1
MSDTTSLLAAAEDEQSLAAFLRTVNVGDVLTGTVAGVTRSQTTVRLDAFVSDPVGIIGPLDCSWRSEPLEVGGQVSAEVIAVDLREQRCGFRGQRPRLPSSGLI